MTNKCDVSRGGRGARESGGKLGHVFSGGLGVAPVEEAGEDMVKHAKRFLRSEPKQKRRRWRGI